MSSDNSPGRIRDAPATFKKEEISENDILSQFNQLAGRSGLSDTIMSSWQISEALHRMAIRIKDEGISAQFNKSAEAVIKGCYLTIAKEFESRLKRENLNTSVIDSRELREITDTFSATILSIYEYLNHDLPKMKKVTVRCPICNISIYLRELLIAQLDVSSLYRIAYHCPPSKEDWDNCRLSSSIVNLIHRFRSIAIIRNEPDNEFLFDDSLDQDITKNMQTIALAFSNGKLNLD